MVETEESPRTAWTDFQAAVCCRSGLELGEEAVESVEEALDES